MESMEALRDLLVPDIQGDIVDNHGTYYAKLREGSSESKLKRIDIYGVPKDSILIKLDEYDQPITLFKNDKGQRQRCDYVLFSLVDGKGFVLFIEIKSAKVKKRNMYVSSRARNVSLITVIRH